MNSTFLTHLHCSTCLRSYSADTIRTYCPTCNKALLAMYDLHAAKRSLSRDTIAKREGTLWRYRELLPVIDDTAVISLGEGWTPLIHTRNLGRSIGLDSLYIKEEGYNPTGSFKARGLSVAISKAKEFGIREASMPSAGNAGGALAAYAAKAGMKAHVFVPKDTPSVNIREVTLYGGTVYLVEGVISDAAKKMNEMRSGTTWFDFSTMKEPYRLEGKKTMGYELAEQFAWHLPDVILYPTGGGTGLIGMWKAFKELETLGWISEKRPRMISVQAAGCAPIVKAFRERKRESEFWHDSHTAASGLRVPKAFADTMILDALYESGGTAVEVAEHDILSEIRRVAECEGIFLCPEGAAAIGALRLLMAADALRSTDTVVVFNTGSGYKYTELLQSQTNS